MRNFENFLKAYLEYAEDSFCPPQFHLWTGLTLISSVLEGKVWVTPFDEPQYPNIYTLLVSHPGEGKSTALDRGVKLTEELKQYHNSDFKIIPSQVSEPGLIELMNLLSSFHLGTSIVQYSSGFFYASEAASSAFKNEHGDFNATVTAFYDCPQVFRKKLKMDAYTIDIPYVRFHILAATTFDFLKTLVNEESVLGGLASRFIYVIDKERKIKSPKWSGSNRRDTKLKARLVSDLAHINKLIGRFEPTPEFIKSWEDYQPEFHRYLVGLKSPRMESLMARKATNLLKVAMLLSVSESDSLILNLDHWEKARELIENVTKDNSEILSSAIIAKKDTQEGLNQFILESVKRNGGKILLSEFKATILKQEIGRAHV